MLLEAVIAVCDEGLLVEESEYKHNPLWEKMKHWFSR